jgi:hypothetical protein
MSTRENSRGWNERKKRKLKSQGTDHVVLVYPIRIIGADRSGIKIFTMSQMTPGAAPKQIISLIFFLYNCIKDVLNLGNRLKLKQPNL